MDAWDTHTLITPRTSERFSHARKFQCLTYIYRVSAFNPTKHVRQKPHHCPTLLQNIPARKYAKSDNHLLAVKQ